MFSTFEGLKKLFKKFNLSISTYLFVSIFYVDCSKIPSIKLLAKGTIIENKDHAVDLVFLFSSNVSERKEVLLIAQRDPLHGKK